MSKSDDLHVLIVGAGINGLLIAHGLKKAGIKYSLFEAEKSASAYRVLERSISIHWSIPMLQSLLPEHLANRLDSVHNDPFNPPPENDVFKVYNGLTGDVMREVPIPKTLRVSRNRIRQFVAQDIDVLYDHKLIGITYGKDGSGVTAKFENGNEVSGTNLIGTDGPRSKVRELLLGEERAAVTPLNLAYFNSTGVRYDDPEKARFVRTPHPVWSMVMHPELACFFSIEHIPDPDKPETWQFQISVSWPGEIDYSLDNTGRLALIKSRTSVLPEPFRSAVQWIPDNTKVGTGTLGYWIPIPWNEEGKEGRVTLAGDAAHPMPPHRGQGLNNGICDAKTFVEAMKKVRDGGNNLKDGVEAYNDDVVKRCGEEVRESVKSAEMAHDWDKVSQSPLMTRSLFRD